jgi:hypothetical protein
LYHEPIFSIYLARSTKFQAPNHKQIPISKIPNNAVLVIWSLKFGAYLDLGICDLEFTQVNPSLGLFESLSLPA